MRFITADRIFNGHSFLAEGSVLVLGERNCFLGFVTSKEITADKIERFEGVITPGFVNSHCHLELSHLKNKIPKHTGLPEFAKQVILLRQKCDRATIAESQREADKEMWENGIVAVGDISNGPDSFPQKSASNIFYHTFIELIGLNPDNAEFIFEKGVELHGKLKNYQLKGSFAPHAPYSTSAPLIKKISEFDSDRELPFSIHNQESVEETKFFQGEKSGFDELYKFLNLDLSWFVPPGGTSLQNYVSALSISPSLLVHNTITSPADLSMVTDKNIYWCFCPCANKFIENRLPDFEIFRKFDHRICLGTDSLASNAQLSLVEEANQVLTATDTFSVENLLRAITFNPAEALGLTNAFGHMIEGRNAGLNLIKIQNGHLQFIKKIV